MGMVSKATQTLKLILGRTPDQSTSQGRGHARYRRAAATAVTSLGARGLNIIIGLVTVPLTLGYLGGDRYGLWMAISSFTGFLSFTDLGIGIGLQNALTRCHGRDDYDSPRVLISSGLAAMLVAFAIIAIAALVGAPLIPWESLVKVSSREAKDELLPTVQAMTIAFAIGLPAGISQRVFDAYQQGFWGSALLAVGRLAALAGILLCVFLKLGLPYLSATAMGIPFIATAAGSILIFKDRPWLVPSLRAVRWTALSGILRTGLTAVAIHVSYALVYSGPAIIIANRLGAAEVTPFAVTQKLLGVSNMLLAALVLPLWPAYGEAAARGDWSWVKKTVRRTMLLGAALQVPVFLAIAFGGRSIVRIWAGPAAVPDPWLLMAINIWYLLSAWNMCSQTALNGMNHLAGQATYGSLFAILGLGVAWWAVPHYGVNGVVFSVVLLCTVLTGLAQRAELRRVLRRHLTGVSIPAMDDVFSTP